MKFLNRVHISGLFLLLIALLIAAQAKPLREGFQQTTNSTNLKINLNCTPSGDTVSCVAATSGMVKSTTPSDLLNAELKKLNDKKTTATQNMVEAQVFAEIYQQGKAGLQSKKTSTVLATEIERKIQDKWNNLAKVAKANNITLPFSLKISTTRVSQQPLIIMEQQRLFQSLVADILSFQVNDTVTPKDMRYFDDLIKRITKKYQTNWNTFSKQITTNSKAITTYDSKPPSDFTAFIKGLLQKP